MLLRFLIYGFLGWCLEIAFTGISSLLKRDRSATGKTYLWMHPIYGATALLMERVHDALSGTSWLARGVVYLVIIYAVEFSSGWALRRVLGSCPWDYGKRGLSVRGLIRLDYAPAWFLVGLGFEPVRQLVWGIVHAPEVAQAMTRVLAFA